MKNSNYKRNLILLGFMILTMTCVYLGCSDTVNPPGGGGQTDTTVANFNNRVVFGRPMGGFDTSHSAIDFFRGLTVTESEGIKDAVLIDSADVIWWLRSGHMSDISVPGYQTRFSFAYLDMTQGEFDTLSKIPDSNDSLTADDFTMDQTNTITENQPNHPVYGFYLKGKFESGLTAKQVFGLLYIDKAVKVNGRLELTLDIKINKNGENRFAKNIAL